MARKIGRNPHHQNLSPTVLPSTRMPTSRTRRLLLLLAFAFLPEILSAQAAPDNQTFSRRNTYSVSIEGSNDSSHILLGVARNRKLLNFGLSYSRRLLLRPSIELHYLTELRPVIFESDPVVTETFTYIGSPNTSQYTSSIREAQRCEPGVLFHYSGTDPLGNPFSSTVTAACGQRQSTIGAGWSPLGLKLNVLPRHRLQPVVTALGGYMFSAQAIPISTAGNFNYTFSVGAGIELFCSHPGPDTRFGTRSLRAEYRYHHISNKNTATENPGIDNGLFQLTYSFGR